MFTGNDPLPLGAYVQDILSGFEGYVTAKFYHISGCCNACVESTKMTADGKEIERFFSTKRLKRPTETALHSHPPIFLGAPKEETTLTMGMKARAAHRNVEGVITVIAFYPDNAPHGEIVPPYNAKEGKKPDAVSIADFLIEEIGAPTHAKPTGLVSGVVPVSRER